MDSVDSDGIGSNQSFSGQARSASTSPWFFGGSARTETILTVLDPFDLERLARFDAILPAKLGGQYDLALQGDLTRHASKIASYIRSRPHALCKPVFGPQRFTLTAYVNMHYSFTFT